MLAEAFAVVDNNDEHFYEAELYRLQGELTLQQFNVQGSKFKVANPRSLIPNSQAEAEAEACFLKAIDIARKQQAKLSHSSGFSGGAPTPFVIPLNLCSHTPILGYQLH